MSLNRNVELISFFVVKGHCDQTVTFGKYFLSGLEWPSYQNSSAIVELFHTMPFLLWFNQWGDANIRMRSFRNVSFASLQKVSTEEEYFKKNLNNFTPVVRGSAFLDGTNERPPDNWLH